MAILICALWNSCAPPRPPERSRRAGQAARQVEDARHDERVPFAGDVQRVTARARDPGDARGTRPSGDAARVELVQRDALERELLARELAVVERLDRHARCVAREGVARPEQVLDALAREVEQLLLHPELDGTAHGVVGVDPQIHVQFDASGQEQRPARRTRRSVRRCGHVETSLEPPGRRHPGRPTPASRGLPQRGPQGGPIRTSAGEGAHDVLLEVREVAVQLVGRSRPRDRRRSRRRSPPR